MKLQETIKKILREEINSQLRRRLNFGEIDTLINRIKIGKFKKDNPIEDSIDATIQIAIYDIMPREYDNLTTVEYFKIWDGIKEYLKNRYTEELRQYFEKRQRDAEEDKNPLGIKYIFVKHDKPYYNSGWRGFAEGFDSFSDMITQYGNWIDVDWDEIKKKLDNINDYPDNTFTGRHKSRPLKLLNIGEEGNRWGYNFSVVKTIPSENLNKVVTESKDPKVGTGKKPEGSGRRLYTDENPSDTVSVKFRTKEDIIDTLNKESFKSKSHKRQSQIINLIHQRVRAAYQNAKDPETKERLKRGLDYIESKKEQSKQKTIRLQKEGLHDTSWENDKGDKITLMDLLNATENIPVEKISVDELKPYLLTWDGDEEERGKIDKADLQYPILIFVDDDGSFISIVDGHHRAQKALRKGLDTIKAKIIPINSLPKNIRKVFSHMGKQEEMKEGELTERCWKGYTQKGMKTMFGKRYPNCVKIKK